LSEGLFSPLVNAFKQLFYVFVVVFSLPLLWSVIVLRGSVAFSEPETAVERNGDGFVEVFVVLEGVVCAAYILHVAPTRAPLIPEPLVGQIAVQGGFHALLALVLLASVWGSRRHLGVIALQQIVVFVESGFSGCSVPRH